MARQRTGWVRKDREGRWSCRLTFTDEFGKYHDISRRADNKSEAKETLKRLLRELDDHGGKSLLSTHKTFEDLAEFYETTYLIEPEYRDGRKVAGLRTYIDQKSKLQALRAHFGTQKLRGLSATSLDRFKAHRLKTPKEAGGKRAIASVNRELALLRRMLNVALEEKWILQNPFTTRKSLISTADERQRERILTREEEQRLLAACDSVASFNPRAHLKPIIICALDTGMRRGEILKLKWSDVDFINSTITVRAFNTKTMRKREVVMTERLSRALGAFFESSEKNSDALCFGFDEVKGSFAGARTRAGLPDVRFHDLRHTAASRLVSAHIPLSEVGKILGHTQPATTYRYVNANVETARRAAAALDAYNSFESIEGESESVNEGEGNRSLVN